jgi:molybdate transport system substrate-binding protein
MSSRGFKFVLGWIALLSFCLLAWISAACKGNIDSNRAPNSVSVFAAASLTEALGELKIVFERQNPGITVNLNLAGSQQLALEIEQGAQADVFASADSHWMSDVQVKQLIVLPPRIFAGNSLVVVTPKSNPAHIDQLQDLARPGLKIVIAAEAVPIGRYSREALEKLSHVPEFSSDYRTAVLRNVVSNEENVKAVLGKVQLAEADAGIVYRSDITAAVSDKVRVLEIPSEWNVVARYPIAVLKRASNPLAAEEFVALIMSEVGQHILRSHHFIPRNQL